MKLKQLELGELAEQRKLEEKRLDGEENKRQQVAMQEHRDANENVKSADVYLNDYDYIKQCKVQNFSFTELGQKDTFRHLTPK